MGVAQGLGLGQGLWQGVGMGMGQGLGVGAPPLSAPAEPLWYRVRDAEVACVGWEEVRGAQALLLMYVQEHVE